MEDELFFHIFYLLPWKTNFLFTFYYLPSRRTGVLFSFSVNPIALETQFFLFFSMGLISNAYRVERSTNFLIMRKRKYGAMPLAKTVWRLLMPCMREHRKTVTMAFRKRICRTIARRLHWIAPG